MGSLLDPSDPGGTLVVNPDGTVRTVGGGYTHEDQRPWWERLKDQLPSREGLLQSLTPENLSLLGANLLPGTSLSELPQAGGEFSDAHRRADPVGMATAGMKGVNSVLGALPVIGAADRLALAGARKAQTLLRDERMAVDGTINIRHRTGQDAPPVLFRGKEPNQFTPQEWGDFGRLYGVDNLGPADESLWRANLGKAKTIKGTEFTIPGGADSKAPFTYYDLLHMKAQGINPEELTPELHQKIHDRMVAAMQPGPGGPSDLQIANQTAFGMISPNQPLTPNELALNRVMVKGPKDLEALGDMLPYRYDEGGISKQERNFWSRDIATKLGVQAKSKGGLGVSGSADYSNIAEMAQKLKDQPGFFRFNPNDNSFGGMTDAEKWSAHVTRLMNETRGLAAKTGSLASVWQSPQTAAISAIDRHMATKLFDNLFANDAEKAAFKDKLVSTFNAGRPEAQHVKTFEEMQAAPGGRGHFVEKALDYVDNTPEVKTRDARTGEYNPRISEAVRNTNWISGEPRHTAVIEGPYVRALNANADDAAKTGQGTFSNQWMVWDRIRKRLEPHEILFPGLEKLPRMSMTQMKAVARAHSKAGYMAAEGAVKPVLSPSQIGYFSAAPLLAGGAVAGSGLLGEQEY